MGIISFPMNMALECLLSGSVAVMFQTDGLFGSAIILVVGVIVGQMQEVGNRLKLELEMRQIAVKALQDQAAEIERQRRYFEALVRNSPITIVGLDLDHNITFCNPAFEELFGYSASEIIGEELDGLIAQNKVYSEASELTKRVQSG